MSSHPSSDIIHHIGLIGVGQRLQSIVRRFLDAGGRRVKIAAICDPDTGVAQQAIRHLGAEDATLCASVGEMLAIPRIDWVFVGSYNHLHAEHAIAALRAGKHVFAEKPLATTLEDAVAICRTIRKTGRVFSFGLVLRYATFYRTIRELLAAGRIGELISMEFNETLDFNHGGHIFSNWRRFKELSGGHMLEKCCHDLDLANWFVGSEAVRCASFGGKRFFVPKNTGRIEAIGRNKDGLPAYLTWPGQHPYDPFGPDSTILDHQVGIIEYRNGVRATFHTNANTAFHERRFYLCGSEGTLRADLATGLIEVKRIGFDTEIERIETRTAGGHGDGDEVMVNGLVATLCEGTPPLATAADGLEASLVAFALTEAAEQGVVCDIEALRQQVRTALQA